MSELINGILEDDPAPPTPSETTGIALGAGAYLIWGFMPLYWRLLGPMPTIELTTHRLFWCALVVTAATLMRGRARDILAILRDARRLGGLALSSLLITANWTLFIYSVENHRLVEAALGYYTTPLVSIALGLAFLGERLSRLRLFAIALALVAVVAQTVALGHFPWLALSLSLTFGFYGYLRKLIPVDALDGLTVETCLFLPLTAALVAWWGFSGTGLFPRFGLSRDIILIFGGVMTSVPLALFAASARRVRMTTLGFLQYLSPSITLIVATVGLGEPFTPVNAISFACIWTALIIVSAEGQISRLALRRQV